MRRLTLTRKLQSDQGTFGRLSGEGLSLHTAELPWRDNKRGISRIMPGIYRCVRHVSAKYPEPKDYVFRLLDVPGREAVLIHNGNFAGDKAKGYRSDVEGCILVGLEAGTIKTSCPCVKGQDAVLRSKDALNKLREWAGQDDFELEITEEWQG
ncbi:MAG: DUF5675 family protein [Deltaproteobacteria bacterium]|jgi:hypothetical protein|nr:DUF5675 family protein [Deltaproteobacteria bacterium]